MVYELYIYAWRVYGIETTFIQLRKWEEIVHVALGSKIS